MKIKLTILSFFVAINCFAQSSGYVLQMADGSVRIPNGAITNAMLASPPSVGNAVYARVTGSNSTTTGQALADISGLTVPLLANATYEFEAILMVQSSSTAGNQYGVNFSAAGSTVEAQISGTLAAATSRCDRVSVLNTATPTYLTSGATGGIRIHGIIVTTTNSGNLTVKQLKVTSGTATCFINSFIKVTRIL